MTKHSFMETLIEVQVRTTCKRFKNFNVHIKHIILHLVKGKHKMAWHFGDMFVVNG